MWYKLDEFEWYIDYNKERFWFANGTERNFFGTTKEDVIAKINKWYMK